MDQTERCRDPQRGMTNADRKTYQRCNVPRGDAKKRRSVRQQGAGDTRESKSMWVVQTRLAERGTVGARENRGVDSCERPQKKRQRCSFEADMTTR